MVEKVVRSYRDLVVWRRSMDLAIECYRATDGFPAHETYGLASQIRRAAVSIPANVAEGHARVHRKEFEHHLSIARGSLAEFETHLEIAASLGYLSAEQTRSLKEGAGQTGRMLNALLTSLRKKRDSAKVKKP
ncbi:MAG: four helix bundle protein [Deferrisomatales bacterium]|nr:four helix bundle protein [Deferrisomatales bacterium]